MLNGAANGVAVARFARLRRIIHAGTTCVFYFGVARKMGKRNTLIATLKNQSYLSDKPPILADEENEIFSIPNWLNSLNNDTDNTPSFHKFIAKAENFDNKVSEYDIILDLLKNEAKISPYKQILIMLENNKISAGELGNIYRTLELILLRIIDDLSEYSHVGNDIVQHVCNSCMTNIYWMLGSKKAQTVKKTLKLLSVFVLFNQQAASEVLTHFDFFQATVKKLNMRTDINDEQNIRVCYIYFLLSFLFTDDDKIIFQLMEKKELFKALFVHLVRDSAPVIGQFLSTIMDKVICNKGIPKTLKVQLVNGSTLYHLAKLYTWNGQQAWQYKKSRGGGKMKKIKEKEVSKEKENIVPICDAELNEEQKQVYDVTNKFLLALCSSYQYGILFHDYQLGAGRHVNFLVTQLLYSIKNPHTSSYTTNLFVQILSSAPDQLKFYTSSIKNVIEPRPSEHWINIMNFLIKIYDAQDVGQFLASLTTKLNPKEIVILSSKILFPSIISRDVIRKGLKHEAVTVNRTMLDYLCHLVKRLSEFCALLKHSRSHNLKCFDESDIPAIIEGVGKSAAGILLDAKEMDELWESMKQSSNRETSRFVELDLILNIQTKLKQIFPLMMKDSKLDLIDIIENRKDLARGLTPDEFSVFQLKVVELLVKTESKKIISSPIVETLINIILEKNAHNKNKAPALLIEMFIESGFFNSSDEIQIWCSNFFLSSKNKKVVTFFVAVILKFIKMNLQNDGQECKASAGTVSCMLRPAFKIWSVNPTFENDKNCQLFLSNVLINVYHMDPNKTQIEKTFEKNKSILPASFHEYMNICSLDGGIILEDELEVPQHAWKSLIFLMKYRHIKFISLETETIIEDIDSMNEFMRKCLIYQILFYIDIILNEQNSHKTEIVQYFFKLLSHVVISPKEGEVQKEPCSIVFAHRAIKKCFLNRELESNSNLVFELISLVGDHFHEIEPFSWYSNQTMTFVENLATDEKKMSLQMKQVVVSIFQHTTNVDILRVFESLSENVLAKHSWLAKMLCLRICDVISQDHSLRLSNKSAEILLRQINNKSIATEVVKLIKAVPVYCYSFKPGVLKSFLVEKKQHSVKVLGYALCQNGFIRKEFEDMCLAEDLSDLNHKSVLQILQVYLQSHKSLFKDLLTEEKSSVSEKLSLVTETLEKKGILNINSKTIDIYLDLIDLNVKDWESVQQNMKTEILALEDEKDLERIKTLCRFSNDKGFWNHVMKKCFKRVQEDLHLYLLKSLLLIQEKVKEFAAKYSKLNWNELIKNVLLISLNDVEKSEFLEFIHEFVHKYNIYVEAEFISDMIFGHSNFMTIMLANHANYSKSKELLVDILIELTKRDTKIIKSLNIPLFLASYNATLSLFDQKILYLMHLYHLNGVNFDAYKPFLWGRMAIDFYSVRKGTSSEKKKAPAVEDVLQHFDKSMLMETAMKFPVDLVLQPEINESVNDSTRLDPRFLFPLLSSLLSPSFVLNCIKFLDCKVLPVIFASLSSNCSEMRKTGYYTLMLFNEHLDKAKYSNKGIWLHLLSILKNGIETENMKLPNVISVYLAKVTPALHSFEDPLHKIVASFLLLKSDLDMKNVPDFLHLFNSSYLERDKHQEWILNLLIDGVKDVSDYFVCENKFLNKIMLSFCASAVCRQETVVQILLLLIVFADIPTAARRLVALGGVLPYLQQILVKHGSTNSTILTYAICFVNKLWLSMIKSKKYDQVNQESEPIDADKAADNRAYLLNMYSSAVEFHLVCNSCMDLIAANPRLHDWEVLTSTLASIYDHMGSRNDMKFYAGTIACAEQIDKVLKIHKLVLVKNKTDFRDVKGSDPRFSSAVSANNKLAVNKILLQFCLWSIENDSFKSDVSAFYQTCFRVVEYILLSSYFKETAQYQMDFLKFIEKLFSIETHDGELIARQTLQNNNIVSGLLQCYSYHNPYSEETASISLLTQLNITMRIVLMEIRHSLSQWFVESNEEDRLTWERAIDCYNALSRHKSAVTVSSQCSLSILACEFLLRKTTPHLFDSLAHSSGIMRKLRKRCLEKCETDSDSKAKHKKRH